MAIQKFGEGGAIERRVGLKVAAKKAAKHAVKKHAAKKHAAKHAEKHAAKHVNEPREQDRLEKSYHHLQRAAAVISLLEQESGGDLRELLEHGLRVYKIASSRGGSASAAAAAHGLARAVEHLAMAGLYAARIEFRPKVPVVEIDIEKRMWKLRDRLYKLGDPAGKHSRRLADAARELAARADAVDDDPHMKWELLMAAEGIAAALEDGS